MGRWIVIISLTIAQCPDIATAAPPSSGVPLPKPRPVRLDHSAAAADAVETPSPAADSPAAEETSVKDWPLRQSLDPSAEALQEEGPGVQLPVVIPAPAPKKSNGDCGHGKRIISAYYSQGVRTASGEPFDPHGLTAAHRTLPFGTRLTVSNPRTGQSVAVVINDRGPFVSGVSLDLSLGAAQAIGMHGTGAVCIQ